MSNQSVLKITLEGGPCGGKMVTPVQLPQNPSAGKAAADASLLPVDPLVLSQDEQMSQVLYLIPQREGKAKARVICREMSPSGDILFGQLPVHVEEVRLQMARKPQGWEVVQPREEIAPASSTAHPKSASPETKSPTIIGVGMDQDSEEGEGDGDGSGEGEEEDEGDEEDSGSSGSGGSTATQDTHTLEDNSLIQFRRILPAYKAVGTLHVTFSVLTQEGHGHSMEMSFNVKFLTYRNTPGTKESKYLQSSVHRDTLCGSATTAMMMIPVRSDVHLQQEISRLRDENSLLRESLRKSQDQVKQLQHELQGSHHPQPERQHSLEEHRRPRGQEQQRCQNARATAAFRFRQSQVQLHQHRFLPCGRIQQQISTGGQGRQGCPLAPVQAEGNAEKSGGTRRRRNLTLPFVQDEGEGDHPASSRLCSPTTSTNTTATATMTPVEFPVPWMSMLWSPDPDIAMGVLSPQTSHHHNPFVLQDTVAGQAHPFFSPMQPHDPHPWPL